MFKMNPHAKEFVPAHILRKRKEQEEADRLAQLTDDIGKVNLKNENGTETTDESKNQTSSDKTSNNTTETPKQTETVKSTPNESPTTKTTPSSNQKKSTNNDIQNSGEHFNQNLPEDYYYPDEDEYGDDDPYLANGENICEFNGEQFIIPNDDDEFEPPQNVAYDFGNDEDNEDEDVRKAFEEFLGDLPQ